MKSTDFPELFTFYLYAAIHMQSTTTKQDRPPSSIYGFIIYKRKRKKD